MSPEPVDVDDLATMAGPWHLARTFARPSARRMAAHWMLTAPPLGTRLDARPWLRWTHGALPTNAQIAWLLRTYPHEVDRVMREHARQMQWRGIAGAI